MIKYKRIEYQYSRQYQDTIQHILYVEDETGEWSMCPYFETIPNPDWPAGRTTFISDAYPVVIPLNKENPAETIERFYKLLVLK